MQNKKAEQNTLCEVAFQCMRQFAGISMLVKQQCFACNKPSVPRCARCQCACFCSKECEASEIGNAHQELCKLVQQQISAISTEEEAVTLF